jgi:phytoene dehydrogenase-like protein
MGRSVIIVGAGMGGLAAGIYGQASGYETQIFEQHALPGGQCAAWKRKGYTFDACIHHLFGCARGSKIYRLWEELGAMPRDLVPTEECVSVAAPDGKMFNDYWETDLLRHHMEALSPADSGEIEKYVKAIRQFSKVDFLGEAVMGSRAGLAAMLPRVLPVARWFGPDMEKYAKRYEDPFLRRAMPLVEYSLPEIPLMIHLVKHAYGLDKNIAWPVGGAAAFARSIEKKYTGMGGEVHYGSPVREILTHGGRAMGVRLEDGTEERGDIVISNADGRKTITRLLGRAYVDDKIKAWLAEPDDLAPFALQVFLGVDRDLTGEPSALVQLLEEPVEIAGHPHESLEMQTYGFDPSMAPEGKGVIKVELFSSYAHWKKLYADRPLYDEEKERTAATVIEILDRTHFAGVASQVEVIDVPTLMTWERYVGGEHGFLSAPNKKVNPLGFLFGLQDSTLPGLEDFYMVGTWATSAGSLFQNALSGRKVVQMMCRSEGKRFVSP